MNNNDNLLSCYYCCTSFNKEDLVAFGLKLFDDNRVFCPRCNIDAIIPYKSEDELNKYHCKQFNHSVSLKKGFKSIDDIERHHCHCPQDPCCVNCDTDIKNKKLDRKSFRKYYEAALAGFSAFIKRLTRKD